MRKTSVYLNDDESERIAQLAEREGTSQAEIIRKAIRGYRSQHHGDRTFALAGAGKGPGGSVAEVSETESLDGFGG